VRVRIAGVKPVHQFRHIAREVIDIAAHMATQGAHGRLIAARRAAKAEIDTPGIEGIQGAELLGDHQRRMVGQHHAAGTQMQSGGIGGEIANQHRGRRAGNADHIMVLRQPVAVIAARFGQPGEIQRVGKGFFGRRSLRDRRQIEHRERNRFVSHKGSLCYSIVIRLKVFFQPGASRTRQPEKLHL
jgi:hypothetical protein